MSWRTVRFRSAREMLRTAWKSMRNPSKLPKRILRNQLIIIAPSYMVGVIFYMYFWVLSSECHVLWVYAACILVFMCGVVTVVSGAWPLLPILNVASMLTFYARPGVDSLFQAFAVWSGYNLGWFSAMFLLYVQEWFRRRRGVRGSIDPYCERLYRLGWARPGPDPPSWSTREEWEAFKRYTSIVILLFVMGTLYYVFLIPLLIIEIFKG